MGTFGGRGRRPNRPANAGAQGEIFIKNPLPKGKVQAEFWVLDPNPPYENDDEGKKVPLWYNIEQHFDPVAKRSWPCAIAEDAVNCVGCEFPIEDPTNENDRGLSIRDTSSQYIIPVVDEQGYVSLIQFGYRIWAGFCNAFDLYGNVNDAWYLIKRNDDNTFSVLRTAKTEKPEVKIDVPDDDYISHAVGKRYLEAMERYNYTPDESQAFSDTSTPDTVGGEPQPTEPTPEPTPGEGTTENPPASEPGPDATGPSVDGWDPNLNAREASVGELKDWLDSIPADTKFGGPREYPKKPSRPVLVQLVEKAQTEFAPF